MAMRLTIFPSGDSAGSERARLIAAHATALGYEARVAGAANVLDAMRACLCDTAVVFDLSAACDGGAPRESAAYRVLFPAFAWFQHVLVVSTGYLPLNVMPIRRGGAPGYPFPEGVLPGGRTVEPVADVPGGGPAWVAGGDVTLLDWAREQLAAIAGDPALPSLRCGPVEWERAAAAAAASDPAAPDALFRIEHEMIEESEQWRRASEPDDRVFISYRSRHWDEVRELADDLRSGRLPGMRARPVAVVRPGELTLERELISEGWRWMLVGLIDDLLRACRELWVYETGDYLRSWWTVAELVSAAYIGDGEHGPPSISSVDPASRTVTPSGERYLVRLPDPERREMARFLSMTRPDTMSPEWSGTHRFERLVFRAGLGPAFLRVVRKALADPQFQAWQRIGEIVGDPELSQEMLDHAADPGAYWERISHRSYRPQFWNDFLLDPALLDNAAGYRLDGRDFIDAPERMIRVSKDQAKAAVRSGRLVARDGTRLRIAEFAPRYLWRAARVGGLVGGGLRRLPTYYADEP